MGIGGVVEPGADVAALEAAVDACFETPLSCLGAQEVSDRLVALVRITAKVDALRMEAVQAADRVDVGRLTDQRNTANHVAALTLADAGSVRFDERIIKWLADLPLLAEAFRAGRITTDHVELLRLKDNPRVHQRLINDQQFFIRTFTTCQFRDLSFAIDDWLLGADPDGAEPNDRDQRFGLSITPLPGGNVKVSGILDPLQGAALRDDVNAEANKLRASEKETGAVSTVRRRTLDALMNLVGRGSARPDGSFARPRVNIVMSQTGLRRHDCVVGRPGEQPVPRHRPHRHRQEVSADRWHPNSPVVRIGRNGDRNVSTNRLLGTGETDRGVLRQSANTRLDARHLTHHHQRQVRQPSM